LLYVNSGSGVGGGLVIDGQLYPGNGLGAVEIGHVRVVAESADEAAVAAFPENERRHRRVRGKVSGTAERPRLVVFRSNRGIFAQLVDDASGRTLASASSIGSPP